MQQNKRSYSDELGSEAVKMVNEQGLSHAEAARRLSIPKGTIANWIAAVKSKRGRSRAGDPSVAELAAENQRLRKELNEARYAFMRRQRRTFADSLPVAENLLDQQFSITDPGTVYGADITYIPTSDTRRGVE